jgi:hypothetical protein
MVGMKKMGVLILVVVAILLIGAVAVYLYWQMNANTRSLRKLGLDPADPQAVYQYIQQNNSGAIADQLTTQFDPTQSPVILRVTGINKTSGELQAVGMSPPAWSGRTFATQITCPPWDLRLTKLGSNTSQYVVPWQLLEMIGTGKDQDTIVSGVCSDGNCREIHAQCQIRVFARGAQ